jgi:hypothetical protein
MGGVRREVALRLGVATKGRRWMSRRWPATSNAGSPKQEGKRGGTRGRRQRRGGRAMEDPQATCGLAQWLEVEPRARHRRWAAVAERKQRVTEEEEGRQESEGLICKFIIFQGLLCKGRIPIDTKA